MSTPVERAANPPVAPQLAAAMRRLARLADADAAATDLDLLLPPAGELGARMAAQFDAAVAAGPTAEGLAALRRDFLACAELVDAAADELRGAAQRRRDIIDAVAIVLGADALPAEAALQLRGVTAADLGTPGVEAAVVRRRSASADGRP